MTTMDLNIVAPVEKCFFWAQPSNWGRGIDVTLARNVQAHTLLAEDGKTCNTFPPAFYVARLEWEQQPERENLAGPAPTFHLTHAQAQELMEQLWCAGVRPSQAAGSVGQLAAVEKHLQDMRVMAFRSAELLTQMPK